MAYVQRMERMGLLSLDRILRSLSSLDLIEQEVLERTAFICNLSLICNSLLMQRSKIDLKCIFPSQRAHIGRIECVVVVYRVGVCLQPSLSTQIEENVFRQD